LHSLYWNNSIGNTHYEHIVQYKYNIEPIKYCRKYVEIMNNITSREDYIDL
jgi:hypothetical protein